MRAFFFVCLASGLLPQAAWSAPPTLSYLFPAGGQRGTKVVVACTGSFTWPVKVWAPGLEVKPAKESGKLEITIPKDLAADRVWIRLYNSDGASAPAPFLIDNLKEIAEQEPNDEPRTAQALADPNVVVNGKLEKPADVDCFAVQLKAGQTLVAVVDAHERLGSPMDPILQITNVEGTVLAENNDDVHLDPRLAFTAPKTGTYVVRLFAFSSTPNTDIRLSGAATYIYRLTLTTGPYVTHAVPLAAPLPSPGAVEVFGWNVPPKTKVPVVPFGGPKNVEFQEREVLPTLRLPEDSKLGFALAPNMAGAVRVRLISHPIVSAIGMDPKTPLILMVPVSVTGHLKAARQVDAFRLPLKKGEPVVVSVESNSLGFPFDPVVRLSGPDGKVITSAQDIGPNRETFFTYSAPKDGDYELTVADRFRHGGERAFYRLTVRRDEPDFELSATVDSLVVAPGKVAELPIKIQRRGAVGPIAISALDLPANVTAAPLTSEPSGPTTASVTLKLTLAAGPAFSGPIRIAGKATQPRAIERFVQTQPRLGATFEAAWLTAPSSGK